MMCTAFVIFAAVVAITAPLSEANELASSQQSVAALLKALIQDEASSKMLQQAMVQSIDASAQAFSLDIVGCDTISSSVRDHLSDYLKDVFPGKGITISCAAGVNSGGVTYTRWGHNACPSVPGTQMLYTGRMAGAFYNQKGGGANPLCLPNDPEYYSINTYLSSTHSRIYGTEYKAPIAGSNNHDVPCAVCYATTRAAKLMIPATTSCPSNWTREYYGYIMADRNVDNRGGRNQYICVDKDQVPLPGSRSDIDGNLLYHVKAACSGIQCPPYTDNRALTCAVCTN